MIESEKQVFSGYFNSLSEETNELMRLIKTDLYYDSIAEEMICSIHGRKNNKDYFNLLTSYEDDKELYMIERAMLSIFSNSKIINHYRISENKKRKPAISNNTRNDSDDSLYEEVVEFVRENQKVSTAILQRRFGIGFNRAARLIDDMEDNGIIGPENGSKPREVYL